MERGFCLYSRGMKPYMKSLKDKHADWRQNGSNVTYIKKDIRMAKQYGIQLKKMFALSFQIKSQIQNDQIQIAYCVPYPFSKLVKVIQLLKLNCERSNILSQSTLCSSLGGLPISLLTITQPQKFQVNPSKKRCILVCGRVHPGESNGSYVMQGFLKFICSDTKIAYNLRKHIIFKIVPMINPDGVVLGNYRTGLSGKDFNREYRNPDKDIFPEVYSFKKLVTQTKLIFKNNLLMFLDFHGHSTKKNVFAYGPQFPIMDKFYYQSRIFAKLLQKQNKMFRYHSCVFKVSQCKLATARAILLKKISVPLTYAIEASNGFYHDKGTLTSVPFVSSQWYQMGVSIVKAINEYLQCLLTTQRVRLARQKAKLQASGIKNKQKSSHTQKSLQKPVLGNDSFLLSVRQEQKLQKIYNQIIQQQKQSPEPTSDDCISEGSSDKQDEKDDLSKKQLDSLFMSIKNNNKLGKNRHKRSMKLPMQVFQDQLVAEDDQKDMVDTQRNHFKSYVRTSRKEQKDKITHNQSEILQQVFIAKQGAFLNNPNRRAIISPKYFSQRKQIRAHHFNIPLATTKIICYKFDQQKKKSDNTQTISLFPDFRHRNKSSPFHQGNPIQKSNKSIIISNTNSSPKNIRFQKTLQLDKAQQSFGVRKHKFGIEKRLQELGMDKFQPNYTKFTKSIYHKEQKQQNKAKTINYTRNLYQKSRLY